MPPKILIRYILAAALILASLAPLPAVAGCDRELQAIGALSGGFFFSAQGFIGLAADSYTQGRYSSMELDRVMRRTVDLLDSATMQLGALRGLSTNDARFVSGLIKLADTLKDQARAFATFASTNDPADLERFNRKREEAWTLMDGLFGLQSR